mgnify:CR=1 FL=1
MVRVLIVEDQKIMQKYFEYITKTSHTDTVY